jgi:hypothetical protein
MSIRPLLLAAVGVVALAATAGSARADWRDHGGYHRDWHDHDWHDHWHGPRFAFGYVPPPVIIVPPRRYYAPPPVVYAPPPAYYAPPAYYPGY